MKDTSSPGRILLPAPLGELCELKHRAKDGEDIGDDGRALLRAGREAVERAMTPTIRAALRDCGRALGRRAQAMPAQSRSRSGHARARERRDGSRRHSTRGGTDDDSHPDNPPEDSPPSSDGRHLCACGCNAIATEPRLCACGCGDVVPPERTRYATDQCGDKVRVREHRARKKREEAVHLRPLGAHQCRCTRPILCPDPDGDYLCARCGRHRGPVSLPNRGFDDVDALMRHNGVGVHVGHGKRARRPWQTAGVAECHSRSCSEPVAAPSAFCAAHSHLWGTLSWLPLPKDLPDSTVAALLGLPLVDELAVAA